MAGEWRDPQVGREVFLGGLTSVARASRFAPRSTRPSLRNSCMASVTAAPSRSNRPHSSRSTLLYTWMSLLGLSGRWTSRAS